MIAPSREILDLAQLVGEIVARRVLADEVPVPLPPDPRLPPGAADE